MDPDAPTASTQVHVYIDGPAGSGVWGGGHDALISRPDVAAAFPGSSAEHGYSFALGGIAPGQHTVYVYGINIAGGGGNVLLASKTLTVPSTAPGSPYGAFDVAEGRVGGVGRVAGWTIDPDNKTQSTQVHVYVDGPAGSGARGVNLGTASGSRPDVGKAYPGAGDNHGFDAGVPGLSPGVHTLWVYAINAAGGGDNPLLGTKTITVPTGAAPSAQPALPGALPTTAAVSSGVAGKHVSSKKKSLTKAQRRARALKKCRKIHRRKKRAACIRAAKRRYR